jgi:hypothetical protein
MFGAITFWLNIWATYGLALILILGGGYLALLFNPANPVARPIRLIGFFLMGCGLVLGSHADGERVGGAAEKALWEQANYQAKLDRAKQEADIQKLAADTSAAQATELAAANDELQKQVEAYANSLDEKPPAASSKNNGIPSQSQCPVATACSLSDADVRSLRAIAGSNAASSPNTKRLRTKRGRRPST